MTEAQEAEAKNTAFTIPWNGDDYTIDPEGITLDALEALEAEKVVTGMRLILGDEQYQRYKAANPRVADLAGFLKLVLGTVQGNS